MDSRDHRHVVCKKCGFAGKPAFDGKCVDCGDDLGVSAGGGGLVAQPAKGGKKPARSASLYDTGERFEMNCRNPECNETLVEGQTFCTECGLAREEVFESVTCSFCDLALPMTEAVSNCPRCGTSCATEDGGHKSVDETVAVETLSEAEDDGEDGEDDGDEGGDGKEVKCPACGASVKVESTQKEEFCEECGFSMDEEMSEEEKQAESLVSFLSTSEDPDAAAKEFANKLIWRS